MSPSRQAKSLGLKSLKQVSEMTGESEQTLINWSRRYPKRFKMVLEWCKSQLEEKRTDKKD